MLSGLFIFLMIVVGAIVSLVACGYFIFKLLPQQVKTFASKVMAFKQRKRRPKYVSDLLKQSNKPMAIRVAKRLPRPVVLRQLEYKPAGYIRD